LARLAVFCLIDDGLCECRALLRVDDDPLELRLAARLEESLAELRFTAFSVMRTFGSVESADILWVSTALK
jgi:hypothetical protein